MSLKEAFVLKRHEALELLTKFPASEFLQEGIANYLNDNYIIDWPLRVSDHSLLAHMYHLTLMKYINSVKWHSGIMHTNDIKLDIPTSKLNEINMPRNYAEAVAYIETIEVTRSSLDDLRLLRFINGISTFNTFDNLLLPESVNNSSKVIAIKNYIFEKANDFGLIDGIINIDKFNEQYDNLTKKFQSML